MSETIREPMPPPPWPRSQAVTAVILPEPAGAVVPLDRGRRAPGRGNPPPHGRDRPVRHRLDRPLRLAPRRPSCRQISQEMLADVRNKDVGPAGDSLREIVTTIRGFSVGELDVRPQAAAGGNG